MSIPTVEPDALVVGDSVSWTKYFSDYDPATWTLTYIFAHKDRKYNVTASDNGDGNFLVSIPAATSAKWVPGEYSYLALVTDGTDRYQVVTGRVEFKPDPMGDNFDPRSHVKKTLDALEAVIENRAGTDQLAYSIGGRSITKLSPAELLDWRDKYRRFYADEIAAENVAKGLASGRKIKVRIR